MKAKMILTALLLIGGAHMFAAMKDIPSMRPADIVKLNYATLSPAEQNSLWFTAMFAGLEGTRSASKQVIKNKFPAIKWQNIEQIALKAKQSNQIDAGIAQARATVEPTRTPAVPTSTKVEPTRTPAVPTSTKVEPTRTPAVPTSTKVEPTRTPVVPKPTTVPSKVGAEPAPAPSIESTTIVSAPTTPTEIELTSEQRSKLEEVAKEIMTIDAEIKGMDPRHTPFINNIDTYIESLKGTFENKLIAVESYKQRAENRLVEAEKQKITLADSMGQVNAIFKEGQKLNKAFNFPIPGNPIEIATFEEYIRNIQNKSGLRQAIEVAGGIKDSLEKKLDKLKVTQKTEQLAAIAKAEELDKLLNEIREFDPVYGSGKNYVAYVQGRLKEGASDQSIKDYLNEEQSKLNGTLTLVKAKYSDYQRKFNVIEDLIAKIKEKSATFPNIKKGISYTQGYFENIFKTKGLNEAVQKQDEYIDRLGKIK